MKKILTLAFLALSLASPDAGCGQPEGVPTDGGARPSTSFSGPIAPQGGTVTNSGALTGALALGTSSAGIGPYAGSACGSGQFATAIGGSGTLGCGSASSLSGLTPGDLLVATGSGSAGNSGLTESAPGGSFGSIAGGFVINETSGNGSFAGSVAFGNGIDAHTGAATLGPVALTPISAAPATLQQDWAPTGLATATAIRTTNTTASTICGITGGNTERPLLLHFTGAGTVTLANNNNAGDSCTSTAGNFILTSTGADMKFGQSQNALLVYDSTTAAWRLVAADVAFGTGLLWSGGLFIVDTSVIQARVTGTCTAPQAIASISSTGSVTCTTTVVGGTGTSGTDTRWNGTGTLTNSSSLDDGISKTLAGLKYASCTDTTGGLSNLTIPDGCSTLYWTPASNASLVGISPPSAGGARHITIIENGAHNYTIFPFNTNATATTWQFEGSLSGTGGGWTAIDSKFTVDYDTATSKWMTNFDNNVGALDINGVLNVVGNNAIFGGDVLLSQGVDTFIAGIDALSSGTQNINIDAAGTGGVVRINSGAGGVVTAGTGGLEVDNGGSSPSLIASFLATLITLAEPIVTNGTAPASAAVLTPTLITGRTDNWAPTGFGKNTEVLEVAAAAGSEISSLVAPTSGFQNLTICATSGGVQIDNEGTTVGGGPFGTAANRFRTQGGLNSIILAGGTNHVECADFYYSTNLARWIMRNDPSTINQMTFGNGISANSSGSTIEGLSVVSGLTVSSGNTLTNQTSGSTTTIGSIANSNAQYTLLGEVPITTTGTSSYTPTTGTRALHIMGCGAGGGGGGTAGIALDASVGGGGGGGALGDFWLFASSFTVTTLNVSVAASSAGGTAGANTGGAGGNTTITISGTTYTFGGGNGGQGGAAIAGAEISVGGTGGASSGLPTGGVSGSTRGLSGMQISTTVLQSGGGASSAWGIGGAGIGIISNPGSAATGFCSGGGGAVSVGATSEAGGTGSQGAILIWEYR